MLKTQNLADTLSARAAERADAVSVAGLESESFIVQNVLLGPHYISDLRLSFGPLEVIDLTHEDPRIVKASKDLRNSLRKGMLRRISEEQWDVIQNRQADKERAELLRQQGRRRTQKMEVDGREIDAETFDAAKPQQNAEQVSTAGYANDSLTYATALDIAQTEAELRGEELTAEEFATRVQSDPNLVSRLVNSRSSSVSGDTRKGKAYVATAPGNYTDGTGTRSMGMSNINSDGYLAGAENMQMARSSIDFDMDAEFDNGIADEIDLTAEAGEDPGSDSGGKGRVRRAR